MLLMRREPFSTDPPSRRRADVQPDDAQSDARAAVVGPPGWWRLHRAPSRAITADRSASEQRHAADCRSGSACDRAPDGS